MTLKIMYQHLKSHVSLKIFETLMKVYLTEYLETKNILNPSQHGFRRNYNTSKALNAISNVALYATDKKLSVLSVLIDFW